MTQRSGTAGAQSLAAEAREFTARMAPDVEAWELARHVPESELRACAAQFAQLLVPQNRGGLEATCETAATVLGELAKLDLSFAFSMVVHANLTNAIARYGSEALIERYLTKMLRGEVIGAFCLTEPQAGTDAGAITTSVTANSDGWLLNGCKAWVTNGVFADLFCVYARDRNAGEPSRASSQIGAYLLDGSTRGLRRHEPYQLLGSHLMGTTGLDFESCRVPADGCLFNAGDGFRAAMRGIDLARVLLSSMCCAVLRQAIEEAVVYVKQRRAFGQAIGEFQAIQFQLANMATQLEAAESLTKRPPYGWMQANRLRLRPLTRKSLRPKRRLQASATRCVCSGLPVYDAVAP